MFIANAWAEENLWNEQFNIVYKFIYSVSKSVKRFTALIINYCRYRNSSFHPSNAHKSQFLELYNEFLASKKVAKVVQESTQLVKQETISICYASSYLLTQQTLLEHSHIRVDNIFRDKLLYGFDIHIQLATSYKIIIPHNTYCFCVLLIKILKKLFSPRRKLYTHDKRRHHSI